jgi:hypothetical protein
VFGERLMSPLRHSGRDPGSRSFWGEMEIKRVGRQASGDGLPFIFRA